MTAKASPFEESLALMRENFQYQCSHAVDRLGKAFLGLRPEDERALQAGVERAIDRVDIRLRDLREACVRKEDARLVQALQEAIHAETQQTVQAHVTRCCRAYADDLKRTSTAIVSSLPADMAARLGPTGLTRQGFGEEFDLSACVREFVLASSVPFIVRTISRTVASQLLYASAWAFLTVVSPLAWTFMLLGTAVAWISGRKRFSVRHRVRRQLKEALRPLFSAAPPTEDAAGRRGLREGGIFFQAWHGTVRPDRERDFERLWYGVSPDGTPLRTQDGRTFRGMERILRRMFGLDGAAPADDNTPDTRHDNG